MSWTERCARIFLRLATNFRLIRRPLICLWFIILETDFQSCLNTLPFIDLIKVLALTENVNSSWIKFRHLRVQIWNVCRWNPLINCFHVAQCLISKGLCTWRFGKKWQLFSFVFKTPFIYFTTRPHGVTDVECSHDSVRRERPVKLRFSLQRERFPFKNFPFPQQSFLIRIMRSNSKNVCA